MRLGLAWRGSGGWMLLFVGGGWVDGQDREVFERRNKGVGRRREQLYGRPHGSSSSFSEFSVFPGHTTPHLTPNATGQRQTSPFDAATAVGCRLAQRRSASVQPARRQESDPVHK